MPYNNAYNQSIAAQNQNLYKKKIAYQNACDQNTRTNDVMSPLEGAAMREENVSGGSGTAAATLHDLGYEQMNGVTGSGGEPPAVKKRSYNRKPKPEVVALPTADANQNISAHAGGVSGGGVSAGSADGGGVSAGGVSGGSITRAIGSGAKRGRKAKAEAAEAKVVAAVPPEQAVEVVGASHTPPPAATGSAKPKRTNARAAVVGRIMKEKGMKMAEASKYVKEHGLYKKGGALMTLQSLDAMKPNQGPTPFVSGGVPNTKLVYTDYAPVVKAGRKPRAKKAA